MAGLGRVPAPGDRLTWRGLRLEVLDMDGRRVDKLLVTPSTTPSAE
jgi:putative hemolysin